MKKKNFLAIACALLLGSVSIPLCAQESSNWSMTIGADAASSYLWRGMNLAGPSIQPSTYFDYEKGDWAVSMGAWASKSFLKEDYDEWDLSIEATWRNITLSLANYNEYYGLGDKGSYLDLGLSLTLSEDIPVTFSWYSIANTTEGAMDGGGFDWQAAFPSYFEVSYDFSVSVVDVTVAAGLWPYASSYYENDDFAICNLNLCASHEFELKHGATLPIAAQVMYNPTYNQCFWGVSIGYYFTLDF